MLSLISSVPSFIFSFVMAVGYIGILVALIATIVGTIGYFVYLGTRELLQIDLLSPGQSSRRASLINQRGMMASIGSARSATEMSGRRLTRDPRQAG